MKVGPLSLVKNVVGLAAKPAIACTGDTVNGDFSMGGLSTVYRPRIHGRPNASSERTPYEQSLKSSNLCSICRQHGHKSTICPQKEMLLREKESDRAALTVELLDIGRTLAGFPCLQSSWQFKIQSQLNPSVVLILISTNCKVP